MGLTTEEEREERHTAPALNMPDTATLPDALARAVADAYSGVLSEAMPERMKALLDSIKRLEAGQKKAD